MTAYSELVKKFREKNSKPKTDWKYESWGNPKVERLAVFTNPQFGTQDTYGAPEVVPMTNWRDLIREEGVQVGEQVAEGGRVGLKPGGLVEPGVTHYATKDIPVSPKAQKLVDDFLKQSIAEGKTNFKTITELAEKIKGISYNTVNAALNKSPYINKITFISETNKLDAEIRASEWFKDKFGDKTIKEAAESRAFEGRGYGKGNIRNLYKTWKAKEGKMFAAEFAEKTGIPQTSLRDLQSYSQRKILPHYHGAMKSRIRRAKLYKKLLDESGVTYTGGGKKKFRYTATEEQIEKLKKSFEEANLKFTKPQVDEMNAKTKSLYDDMIQSGNKLTKAKFADLVLDNLSFKPSTAALYRSIERNIPKQDFAPMPESPLQRPKQTKASNIALGKENEFIRQSQDRLMHTVRAHFKSMSNKELRAFIENNPLLKAQVELRFQNNKFKPNYGEFFTESMDELSDEGLRAKAKITVEHIKPYSKAGINVNWPYNRQLAISHINQTLKKQIEFFIDKNEGKLKDPKISTEIKNKLRTQIQAIDNKFKDMNLRLFAGDKGYRGVSEGIAAIDRTAGTLPSYYKTLEGMGLEPNAYAKGEFGKVNVKTVNEFLKSKLFETTPGTNAKISNAINIAKTAKGPAKLKALNMIAATVGTAAAASLFDKFGIDSAMADTGEKLWTTGDKPSGVTMGDFFLAGTAPLATKKGRHLYGKAAKAAFKGMGTVPGLLALEAGLGPGIVASTGGTFGEAIASPLLLEGTIRDKRIYDQLKKEGYTEDQIQVIKDSVMLRADVGDTGLHTSMLPLQEIEHKGKKFTAGDPELKNISLLYDKAATVIADEDKARLKRADEFDYLQLAKGGRVPFGKGKLVDEGRRAFMKWLAGITGAGIAAGTGLIKWGKVAGKGKTAVQVGDTIIQGTQGMPNWFIPLINRVVKEGDDVTKKLGTVEREIVHTKKIGEGDEVTVYQNLDTGNVKVEYQSAHSEVPIQMDYKAPVEDITSKGKPIKTEPEFTAVESEPKWEQVGPDDGDLTFEGENIVGRVEDLTTDTSKLKEFGKNKKLTIKEKIEAKKKQDYRKSLEHDSQTQVDYIDNKYGPYQDPDVGMDEFGNLVDEYGEIID